MVRTFVVKECFDRTRSVLDVARGDGTRGPQWVTLTKVDCSGFVETFAGTRDKREGYHRDANGRNQVRQGGAVSLYRKCRTISL